ncbi:monovalent cation/H+ antiporter subunit A [Aliiruegeria lutimaris]|uniref:Multisubunit potassium/proton antiporter, PhaA subunit /multisubunit potassium/proton antiporter, PhaB subunit n=1 Tax=Aliiruegeria lutimaris TaxID=571298 RepID=A0A1G8ITJ2_9RHOB|nr:monovalent cation/H+ antiporter subunit A [Aliiruegeria lutimaris]SDI22348.1 multisubunit potassium/proton antiporter, PhaA subunit /multisubunit potassium/proton antiporter, PhaB subunit [Aliiruegeria lutimaris]
MTEQSDATLALIAALPFIGALFPGLMIRVGRNACALSAGWATLSALILLMIHSTVIWRGEVVVYRIDWMPMLGLNANFRLDGLGLLFATMILGIGLLIILYARFYLSREDPMGQFYTYLMLFQGAMLGIVLSDNILMMVIFWELTSLSSFLLIGYWKHNRAGRQGARMALAVTGLGGLALIGGMLLLGNAAGSYDLSVILTKREEVLASPYFAPMLILILLGAFTKSAQFPFQFWLPHAMAAPTPVSAYLHSATMVKAGLFLMARLWPVFAGTDLWFYLVATTGLITMLIGAKIAIFKDDLKALLAYSTVSHLGLITMLLGFGTTAAATAAAFHIINHTIFKAALFMTAGIVDHEAHTRSIKRLGGLRVLMPITATLAIITSLSMAGLPFFNGFLSKELMLEEAAHTSWLGNPWLVPVLATLGGLFSAAYSFRYIGHVFLGPERKDYPSHPHDPPFGMWAAPALLAAMVVVIGVIPQAVVGGFLNVVADAITQEHLHLHKLKIWHGFTPALGMSAIATLGGLAVFYFFTPLERIWVATPKPDAKRMYDALVMFLHRNLGRISNNLHDGRLTKFLGIFGATTVALGLFAYVSGSHTPGTREMIAPTLVDYIGTILLIASTMAIMNYHRSRLLVLVLIGINGLIVSVIFVRLSAPDLAMTQVTVEVVTLILMLLALHFLPKHTPRESNWSRRSRDATIAGAAGLSVAALSWALMTRDFETISGYYLKHAKPDGGGTNVVNVILVDFRGYDTFGEIIVLGIAALLIFALEEALMDGRASRKLANWIHEMRYSKDRHPLMMVVATRMMMPTSLMVGVYIFLRGHNDPGGGFIAGLVVAIALLMQYMASGFAWASDRIQFPYHAFIGWGVLTAGITGIGAWFNGFPFLTSDFGYVHLPPIEEFELATAMAFDLGVFLTVVGAVMLAIYSLSRIARRTGESVNVSPMDYDPSTVDPFEEGHIRNVRTTGEER